MIALALLVSAAVLGAAAPASASSLRSPAPAPMLLRADRLEPRARPRTWRGVDVAVLASRLRPGAVISVPRDGRAVGWSRGASAVSADDVEGTIRVVSVPRQPEPADPAWTVEVMLRSRRTGWRLDGRHRLRALDPGVEPGTLFPPDVRRLLVVVAAGWRAPDAVARRWERAGPAAPWQPAGPTFPAVVGRVGVGWAGGLQGAHPDGPEKGVASGQAPAGVFLARPVAGYVSLERGLRGGTGTLVGWQGPGQGTAYEVAVPPEELASLLPWVRQDERPRATEPSVDLVFVAAVAVLPREVYREVAALWGLPPLD